MFSGEYPAMNSIGAHAVRVVFVISKGIAEHSKVSTSCAFENKKVGSSKRKERSEFGLSFIRLGR